MKIQNLFGLMAALVLTTGGDDTTEARDAVDEAVVTIFHLSLCTPDVRIAGDEVAADMGILAQNSFETDAGTIDVEFGLSFISLCTAFDTSITVACGDSVYIEFDGL